MPSPYIRAAGAAGLAIAVFMALGARGLATDEEPGHFLIARHALEHPELFLSPYGRPLVTLGFTLPAQAGFLVARLAAAILTGLTTVLLVRIVRPRHGAEVGLLVACLFLQPYYLAHAGTVTTEPWGACLVALALVAVLERRLLLLALAAGCLPLVRQEWIVFWPGVAWFLARARRPALFAVVLVPMLLWASAGALVFHDPLWVLRQGSWRENPARAVLHYPRSFAWIVGLGLVVPIVLALARGAATLLGLSREEREGRRALVVSTLLVLVMIPVYTVFAVWHPVSAGMHRLFASLAVPLAVLAFLGWRLFLERRRGEWFALAAALGLSWILWGHPIRSDHTILARRDVLPAALALAWIALACFPRRYRAWAAALMIGGSSVFIARSHVSTLHLTLSEEHRTLASVARSLAGLPGDPAILKRAPLLPLFMNRDPYDRRLFPEIESESLQSAASGTWLLWDSHYCPGTPLALAAIRADRTWRFHSGVLSADSTLAVGVWKREPGAREPAPDWRAWGATATLIQADIPRWRDKVAEDPKNVALLRGLARRYLSVGLLEETRRTAERARGLDPDEPQDDLLILSALHGERRYGEAVEAARKALARHPEDGHLHYMTARILVDAHRLPEALEHALRAAALLPGDRDAQLVAGTLALEQGDWRASVRYLERARDLDAGDSRILLLLVEAALRGGQFERSERILREVLDREPENVKAYALLGETLCRSGRSGEARGTWESGFAATGDSTLLALGPCPGANGSVH